ncbi:MAG: SGNH/GDSL hydrolase family protein [Planctomycetota bacterium]|nr:SGNH/GDSL hydrolase family protein [Planctomycetota bacterium]
MTRTTKKTRSVKPIEKLYGNAWYDLATLTLEGRAWDDVERPYHRLPKRAKEIVRDPVWSLGTRATGVRARFVTDSTKVDVRWKNVNDAHFDHMPDSGTAGLDLYVRDAGRWALAGVGRLTRAGYNFAAMVHSLPAGPKEFMIHLPLYSEVEYAHVGVPLAATMTPAPAWPAKIKPMLFYGTSITHGGCASRPGMSYPAQVSRILDRPFWNISFDGNAFMDIELAHLFAELDPSVFVVDAVANMNADMVHQRMSDFIHVLRKARPRTPILVMERPLGRLGPMFAAFQAKELHAALREEFDKLVKKGLPGLHYLPCTGLLGDDNEGTSDTGHPSDLGFYRMAHVVAPVLKKLIP